MQVVIKQILQILLFTGAQLGFAEFGEDQFLQGAETGFAGFDIFTEA